MKKHIAMCVCLIALGAVVSMSGCKRQSDAQGVGEKAGAALDRAAEKTKDVAGQVVEKTGQAVEKAGDAMNRTGEKMQSKE